MSMYLCLVYFASVSSCFSKLVRLALRAYMSGLADTYLGDVGSNGPHVSARCICKCIGVITARNNWLPAAVHHYVTTGDILSYTPW